jgi:hypothetical protein
VDDLRFEFMDMESDLAVHYLRRAAIFMCRRGDLSRQKQIVRVWPNVETYLLEPVDGTELVHILGVRVQGELNDLCGVWRVARLTGEPERLSPGYGVATWFEAPNIIHFRRAAGFNGDGDYEVEFSTCPTRDACEIDQRLYDEHYETLIDGARWLIYDVAGKPWFNPTLAKEYNSRFVTGIMRAKTQSLMGQQRGKMRLAYDRVL